MAVQNPITLIKKKKVHPIVELYLQFNYLKQIFRRGWLLKGITQDKCETYDLLSK